MGDALWHTPNDRLDEGSIPARFAPDWLDALTRAVLAVVDVCAYEPTLRHAK